MQYSIAFVKKSRYINNHNHLTNYVKVIDSTRYEFVLI
jgi:hypothetical protein